MTWLAVKTLFKGGISWGFKHIELIAILFMLTFAFGSGWYFHGLVYNAARTHELEDKLAATELVVTNLQKEVIRQNDINKDREKALNIQKDESEKLQQELESNYAKNSTNCNAPAGVLQTLRRGLANANTAITSESN